LITFAGNESDELNQLIFYRKWAKVFVQRKEADGSITLYPEDQKELLDDCLKIKLFNTKPNEN
jgi:hypothetical protein